MTRIFTHPFSKAYWRSAASELRSTKTLVFAALMIALRVVLKSVSIPIAADLRIGVGFLVIAYGAMVFGPVVAVIAAAITDTLGAIFFPTGVYFFPFIFTEIAGSLIFALFFYKTRITVKRVILSRFCIDFFVNILLQTPIMMLYYSMILGKYYAPVDLMRIVKNLAMFPLESLVLALFLRLVIPPTKNMGFILSPTDGLSFTKKHIILLCVLFAVSVSSVAGYYVYHYNHTSLSASYTASERLDKNRQMQAVVLKNTDFDPETTVTIIQSASSRIGQNEITYQLAIFTWVDSDTALTSEIRDTVDGYSISKARGDKRLEETAHATAITFKDSPDLISFENKP